MRSLRKVEMCGYIRVNIRKARNLHASGVDVYMVSSNMSTVNSIKMEPNVGFEKQVNNYSYYNCNKEVGNDVWFYIKER